ncbi:MAG TPA: urease accessory protein UreD [Terriglobia bacterium]|nr:urease accessory protein UreD [Terriglobia bacterium]
MTVSISEVGRQGRLDIAFALRDGRTSIRHSYCEVPFKITRLLEAGLPGFAHLIVMQCTAGLFGGDSVESVFHIECGARVLLTQQSATKIHPSGNLPAIQRMRIVVESGAVLVSDFEPVIPFAESRLNQSTQIELERGAGLVYWEGLMAGRIGKNERLRFSELRSELRLDQAERPLYLDRILLKPDAQDLQSHWVMNDSGYVGTGLYYGTGADQLAMLLHEAMPGAGVDIPGPDLLVVRVAAKSGPDFHRYRETFRSLSVNFVRQIS